MVEKNTTTPFPFLLLLFFSIDFSLTVSTPIDWTQFTYDASLNPVEETYDYIIVGGGTAGCPLGATLSETHSVLILERGGSPLEYDEVMTQRGFLRTLVSGRSHESPAQPFTSEDGVPNARGRVLGGSSAINAGFYSRSDDGFFKDRGCGPVEWDMALVNESYEWVEKAVTFMPMLRRWQAAVRDSLVEAKVLPYNGFTVHHVEGTKIGGTTFDRSGKRHSAADLLGFARPKNIRVALRATVEKIILKADTGEYEESRDDGDEEQVISAVGVIYRDSLGRLHRALLEQNGEVILSAGALGSPQLLLLSGIGPRQHLVSMGIPVIVHHPHVGKFLYDIPRNSISISSPIPLDHSLIQVVGVTKNGTFIEAASNIIPFFSPSHSTVLHNSMVATLMEKVANPESVGSLRLSSLDVRRSPAVKFNYFSNPTDLDRCVIGMRKVGKVMKGEAMDVFKYPDWYGTKWDFRYVGGQLPVDYETNEVAMREFCRRNVATIWHYHGGCAGGKVVDGEFRVMGVESLRVVDGSTFLTSPGTNPQATVMMMGRYVGLKINEERRRYG